MRNLLTVRGIVGAIAPLAFAAGCETVATNQAASAASKKEALLTQAGFKPKTVTTPKQQQQVSQLAVDRVSAVKYQGKVYYVFPTGKKNQILVGNQTQFNAYKQALVAQQASQKTQEEQQMLQGSPIYTVYGGNSRAQTYRSRSVRRVWSVDSDGLRPDQEFEKWSM